MTTVWSSPFSGRTPLPLARRTNSLAFAKSDCHTCTSLGLRCGRERPRCTLCQDAGRLCQGYSMKLTWQQSHSVSNKPPKVRNEALRSQTRPDSSPELSQAIINTPVPSTFSQHFTFIAARPNKRRKRHHDSKIIGKSNNSGNVTELEDTRHVESIQNSASAWETHVISAEAHDCFPGSSQVKESTTFWQQNNLSPEIIPEIEVVGTPDSESLEQCLEIQITTNPPIAWSQTTPGSTSGSWSSNSWLSESDCPCDTGFSYIPQMYFATLHDKFSGLLNMCTYRGNRRHQIEKRTLLIYVESRRSGDLQTSGYL